jgi:hypothetical protein
LYCIIVSTHQAKNFERLEHVEHFKHLEHHISTIQTSKHSNKHPNIQTNIQARAVAVVIWDILSNASHIKNSQYIWGRACARKPSNITRRASNYEQITIPSFHPNSEREHYIQHRSHQTSHVTHAMGTDRHSIQTL